MKKRIISAILTMCIILSFAVPEGFAEEKDLRDELTAAAQEYIGSPYKLGGTTSAGFDCSGFVQYIFKKFEMSLGRTSRDQAKEGTDVKKKDLLPGDIVYFKQTPNANVSHSGIYIGSDEFISSTTSDGVRIDSLDGGYWGERYAGARRVIEDKEKK